MDTNYTHKDLDPSRPLDPIAFQGVSPEEHKKALSRRTLAVSLISISLTFILTLAIIAFITVPIYREMLNNNDHGAALEFDDDPDTTGALDKANGIIDLIRSEYYIELSDADILEAISSGLPGALGSPYTYYLTAEQNSMIEESMSGHYVGIGCTVSLSASGETEIVEVYAGSPAEEGGLRTGDLIVKVDGEDVTGAVDIAEVAAKVKGEEGTQVVLEIFRRSDASTFEAKLTRRTIEVQNVRHRMLTPEIGYVHVKGFVNGVNDDFRSAMDDLQSQGAKDVVFDLRFNSGGSAAVMLDMLDYLLPKDTLLSTIKGREKGKEFTVEWKTEADMSVPESMRYMILVNSYSASASEFFSGALRDNGKAVIIGEKTFGKGSGTSTYKLQDGSAVNLTIFQYYLPGGVCVEGTGIEPDISEVLADEFIYMSVETLTEEQDTVLQRAVTELKGGS